MIPFIANLPVELEAARALSFEGRDDAVLARMSAALALIRESARGDDALLQAQMLRLRTSSLTRLGRLPKGSTLTASRGSAMRARRTPKPGR